MASYYLTHPRMYRIWSGLKCRCNCITNKDYPRYGGRGIKVAKEWDSFKGFLRDMETGYRDDLSIDRMDNNQGYSKENCRWATQKEQQSNIMTNIKFMGETASDASLRLGGERGLVGKRIKSGWSIEKAFYQPIQYRPSRKVA